MGKVKLPKPPKNAARDQNVAVNRVIDRLVATPARHSFDASTAKAQLDLAKASRFLHARQELTSTERYHLVHSVSHAARGVGIGVGRQLLSATRGTLVESLHSLNKYLVATGRWPLSEFQIEKIVNKRLAKLDNARIEVAANLATSIVLDVQKTVKTSKAETIGEILSDINESLEHQWWRVERVNNTETAAAFNVIRTDAIEELGMWQRWTELVDDTTGKPYDDRVGDDSLVLHGQVALPGNTFIMPPVREAPASMVGDEYDAPPNRPNDRAVLLPWERGSGVPAWVWKNGRRVDLR